MLGLLKTLFLKMIGGSRNERIVRSRLHYVREHPNALEQQVRQLDDEQLRIQMGAAGRKLVERDFGLKHCTERIVEALEEACRK